MGLFLVAGIITTGIAIYAPATALSAVTAMNLDIAILSTGIVWALIIACPNYRSLRIVQENLEPFLSLHILYINRRNESCGMDRCNSIQLDDRRNGSWWPHMSSADHIGPFIV